MAVASNDAHAVTCGASWAFARSDQRARGGPMPPFLCSQQCRAYRLSWPPSVPPRAAVAPHQRRERRASDGYLLRITRYHLEVSGALGEPCHRVPPALGARHARMRSPMSGRSGVARAACRRHQQAPTNPMTLTRWASYRCLSQSWCALLRQAPHSQWAWSPWLALWASACRLRVLAQECPVSPFQFRLLARSELAGPRLRCC